MPWWSPPQPPVWFVWTTLVVGLLAAMTWTTARPGAQWAVTGVAVTGAVGALSRRNRTVADRVLLLLAAGLVAVAALSDSIGFVLFTLFAGFVVAGVAAQRARNWAGVLLAFPSLFITWALSLPWWSGLAVRPTRVRGALSWVRGVGIAVILVVVFVGLLGWADPRYADLVGNLVPALSLDWLPLQAFVFVLMTGTMFALGFASVSTPQWERIGAGAARRPMAEWLIPLGAVDAVLLSFGVVQGKLLFGAYDAEMYAKDVTYADRVHQGFGQLVLVTLLTLVLLGWAGRQADTGNRAHRWGVFGGGGLLVALSLVVVASALRRLFLYEQAYGWTVLRLLVGVFESWLGAVFVLVALTWLVRRGAWTARLVVGSAAVALLGLAVAGPDAVVARWNVDRLERTGKVDVHYLRHLSNDAVPALACLPEPYRSRVLAHRTVSPQPWYAANLSRARAAAVLADPARGCR